MHEADEALLAVYATDSSAIAVLGRIAARVRAGKLAVVDLGLIGRDAAGKVSLISLPADVAAVDVSQPSTVAGLVGLIFPPSALAASIDATSIGAVATQLKRTGVDGAALRRMGAVLDPGESAILVVVDHASIQAVEQTLVGYEHVVRSRLGRPGAPAAESEQPANQPLES